jgi:hypothetical protein
MPSRHHSHLILDPGRNSRFIFGGMAQQPDDRKYEVTLKSRLASGIVIPSSPRLFRARADALLSLRSTDGDSISWTICMHLAYWPDRWPASSLNDQRIYHPYIMIYWIIHPTIIVIVPIYLLLYSVGAYANRIRQMHPQSGQSVMPRLVGHPSRI